MIKNVVDSDNDKVGSGVSITYREVGPTCPSSCPFLKMRAQAATPAQQRKPVRKMTRRCFAERGHVGLLQRKATQSIDDGLELLKHILALPRKWIHRHGGAGDVYMPAPEGSPHTTVPDRTFISYMVEAADRRPDIRHFGYTHGAFEPEGNQVLPGDFATKRGNLVMNASCHSYEDVEAALALGFKAALVLPKAEFDQMPNSWRRNDIGYVKCLKDTVGIQCNRCLWCAEGERKFVVVFKEF